MEYTKKETTRLLPLEYRAEKPIEHINKIINALKPYGTKVTFNRNLKTSFSLNGLRVCYLINESYVLIKRKEDHLTVFSSISPAILGMVGILAHGDFYYLQSDSNIDALVITETDFNNCLMQNPDLQTSVIKTLAYYLQMVSLRHITLSGKNSYTIIRNLILNHIDEPVSLCNSTPIAKYIVERSHLSRSLVMLVLKNLRAGKYITVDHGYLKQISHLPENY